MKRHSFGPDFTQKSCKTLQEFQKIWSDNRGAPSEVPESVFDESHLAVDDERDLSGRPVSKASKFQKKDSGFSFEDPKHQVQRMGDQGQDEFLRMHSHQHQIKGLNLFDNEQDLVRLNSHSAQIQGIREEDQIDLDDELLNGQTIEGNDNQLNLDAHLFGVSNSAASARVEDEGPVQKLAKPHPTKNIMASMFMAAMLGGNTPNKTFEVVDHFMNPKPNTIKPKPKITPKQNTSTVSQVASKIAKKEEPQAALNIKINEEIVAFSGAGG